MYLIVSGKRIKLKVADQYLSRLIGLIGKKNIDYGMYFPKCNSIHTVFMQMNIDVIAFNENFEVIGIIKNLTPFKKFSVKYPYKKTNIIELPSNISLNIKIRDKLFFENEHII